MKVSTLRTLLDRKKRTKVFVDGAHFVTAGFVSRREVGESLTSVKLSPFVVCFEGSSQVLHGTDTFGPVLLSDKVRITRRLQTHRRHLAGREVPERYFEAAAKL